MKVNSRVVGAVLVGVGTMLLTCCVQGVKQQRKLVTKKIAKEAVQSWEGEGGTIIDPVPRSTAV